MKRKLIKTIVFLIVGIALFSVVQNPFRDTDYRINQIMKGFYKEESDLDAILIGASYFYAGWEPALSWSEYGITAYTLSLPGLPSPSFRYMLEEARKTQPDALYIIGLTSFKRENIPLARLHTTTNFMRLSWTKIQLINKLSSILEIKWFDRLEYYFPIIRFHSNWDQLTTTDFDRSLEGLKGSVHHNIFLKTSTDVSKDYYYTTETTEIVPFQEESLRELLDYCEKEQVRVLFVISPQALSKTDVKQLNAAAEYVASRGFDVLNLQGCVEEIGLDFTADYYDAPHTNIHGALKIVNYLGNYLQEHYGFTDKRGDPAYASWDEAATQYEAIIAPYTLDFEREHAARDNHLEKPALKKLSDTDSGLTLSWEGVEGAGGYYIYRKVDNGNWTYLGKANASTTTFTDKKAKSGKKYTYTVVPVVKVDGEIRYGRFNPTGVSATKK